MPQFFFNIYDGVSSIDDTGTEMASWKEARLEAIRLAGSVIKDSAEQVALGGDWHMEVTDERGLVLFRFDFVSVMSSALSGLMR